ncbi:ABC transporter permease [Bacillus spizizenii ATCC 6633 = JCM 2499]|uniref:FtsX-like permease family protein n=2 Tax=Bacillus spizizenii TaxID=96241 RepID=A0A9Q4DNS1_BACSC|nr:FtsX-like permease family protein [Bacillus spizizenii]KFI02846.1 peptide ABC transporter permease [Bacillus sp. BSC154]QCJ18509.1 ABC transporter permease [Bacillus subtilis]ADM39434.1 putative ABC transporter (permease) [Bacillus spizizenii str. W23]AJW84918.1 peptide ABC transporter permease [Bacillus spizizenii]EFG93460.1 putative ABC transporter (permease) [Bacillus spizizenii ATCC 6633 = JCM 2499]
MNLRTIARKNILGNLQRYVAYFLSCVFAVSVFFVFTSFIFHPDVNEDNVYGGSLVKTCLSAALVVIIVFCIFFISYSNSAFLQARKKEFGLLTLFGTSKQQLRKMIYYEQSLISLAAIAAGIGAGLLFSKLFFMIMTWMLSVKVPISFVIVPKAFVMTAAGFLILFQTLLILSLARIRKLEIIELIKAAQKPKSLPAYSKWLTVLSLLCLAGGYYLSATANAIDMVFRVFPILILVLIGTYFFFTQSSVAFFRMLYRKKHSFYKGTNIIVRSNMIFRLKDHARMLFLTSVITAVILTATGVIYMFYADLEKQEEQSIPQSVAWVEKDASSFQVMKPETAENTLKKADADIKYKVNATGIPVTFQSDSPYGNRKAKALLISEKIYNQVAKEKGFPVIHLQENEAFINVPFQMMVKDTFGEGEKAAFHMKSGKTLSYIMKKQQNKGILMSVEGVSRLLVVSEKSFDSLTQEVPLKDQMRVVGYELEHWQETVDVSEKLGNMVPKEHISDFQTRAPSYQIVKQGVALMLFIGLFVSVLFFIVQGSMLYLRMFTEIEDTRVQVLALKRMGITDKEIHSILGRQIGFLFFIPFIAGTIHAGFAYAALSNMLNSNLFLEAVIVIFIYFVFQAVYYIVTRHIYKRAVLQHM